MWEPAALHTRTHTHTHTHTHARAHYHLPKRNASFQIVVLLEGSQQTMHVHRLLNGRIGSYLGARRGKELGWCW